MTGLAYGERPASGQAVGLLVLHHGRGTDERDLLGLADVLDPRRSLHVVTPRAPLRLAGQPGHHWYLVEGVGYPDAETFRVATRELGAFHDALWQRTGIGPAQTVLGGFSMGSVMSYAIGLSPARPAPAGILAFSGFIPTVQDWTPSLADRQALRGFIAHGRYDPVINVGFARVARDLFQRHGLSVSYHEFDGGHQIDPAHVPLAAAWLGFTLQLTQPIS
jgi:phospholipase/carboxylesterase